MPEIVLVIPGIPRAKRSKSGPRYERSVQETAQRYFQEPLRQYGLIVEIHHFYTTGNRLDIDNVQKPIFDGLKSAAFIDDDQIDQVLARRYNLSSSYRIENVREEWTDLLAQGTDFVSVIIQY